jgi:hypothetical protein
MKKVDELIKNSFTSFTGIQCNSNQWDQATLSTSFGGIGLRRLTHHLNAGYVASSRLAINSINSLVPNAVIPELDDIIKSEFNDIPVDNLSKQSLLSQKLEKKLYDSLLQRLGDCGKARLRSASSTG